MLTSPPGKNFPLKPLLALLLIYVAVIGGYALQFDFDFTGFICLGSRYAAPPLVPENAFVLPGSRGYDGQFFYFAAQDPFLRGSAWTRMDVGAYRYMRIFYPWLAWLFALGTRSLLPYTLVFVNLAAILTGSFFLAQLLRRAGLNGWYCCIYGLFSGFILALLRDLAAPLAAGLTVGGIYFLQTGKNRWGGIFFAAAVLTREIMIIVPLVYLFYALFIEPNRKRLAACGFSLVPFLLWSGYVYLRIGDPPYRGGAGNFTSPLSGLILSGSNLMKTAGRLDEKIYFWLFVLVAFFSLLLAVRQIFRRRDEITVLFLLFSLLPVFMSGYVWVEPWSYGRVLVPGAVFLFLSFIRFRDRLYLLPLSGHLILTGVVLFWLDLL